MISTSEKKAVREKGFVTTVILIVVALIAVKYALHFDLVEYLKSPGPQKIIMNTWNWIKSLYASVDHFVSGFISKKK